MSSASPILVFSDDWGRHPSSCQHLIRRLLPTNDVVWINTIGMRPPRLDRATMRRGWEKMSQWLQPNRAKTESTVNNPRVVNPRMWPWVSTRLDRAINRRLLLREVPPALKTLAGPPTVITTVPTIADLIGRLPVKQWVYYCVDDFSAWPGLAHHAIARLEMEMVQRADRIIAASEVLQARISRLGRESHLLTHGVDTQHWQHQEDHTCAAIASLPRPLITFWGVVDRRMDVSFLQQLSADMAAGTIVLAGPLSDPDPQLMKTPRVAHIGSVPYHELPSLAHSSNVLVMPYADSKVTRAMQPLKLKEYLATDRAVVASNLPANRPWSDCLDLAASAEEFSYQVRARLETGLPAEQRQARTRLVDESWDAKAKLFEQYIFSERMDAVATC